MSEKPIPFQPVPRPEHIVNLSFFDDSRSDLKIGVCLRTEDFVGLKIIPTHEVAITIDGAFFSLGSSTMRDLLPRIAAFCDAADALNKK